VADDGEIRSIGSKTRLLAALSYQNYSIYTYMSLFNFAFVKRRRELRWEFRWLLRLVSYRYVTGNINFVNCCTFCGLCSFRRFKPLFLLKGAAIFCNAGTVKASNAIFYLHFPLSTATFCYEVFSAYCPKIFFSGFKIILNVSAFVFLFEQ
jgi:hypothetical protein